jgi:hypothetical protein
LGDTDRTVGGRAADESEHPDPGPARVGRFFVDLMLTLSEDQLGGRESADLVGALWRRTAVAHRAGCRLESDPEMLVRGLAAVAAALADRLVAERRAAGRTDTTLAQVWSEVGGSMSSCAPVCGEVARGAEVAPDPDLSCEPEHHAPPPSSPAAG